jgi:hydrogenase maturation protease
MTGRTLVAGVGNVFLRDDAFGVEVVRLLAEQQYPDGVEIRDFGIRGVHLVYELLNGCDLFVLVDAAARGEPPGTVSVLEVELPEVDKMDRPVMDAHSLNPDAIFALLASLGGRPGRSLVVACEPAEIDAGMGLSDPVREALPHAVRTVQDILADAAATGTTTGSATGTTTGSATGAPQAQDTMTDLPPKHDDLTGKEVTEMLGRLIKAALIAAVLALVIDSLPDIKRYLELREM